MKKLICAVAVVFVVGVVSGADVSWTRFKGKVKAIDQKASKITIQNAEGDLIGIKVDPDVSITCGKEVRTLKDVAIDEKVTLMFLPKVAVPQDDEPVSGVYKPLK